MRTIDEYLDIAREKHGITSDRKLAAAVGLSIGTINQWRTKRAWPGDEAMMRVADLCEISHTEALVELNIWRARGAAKGAYETMLKTLAVLCVIAAFSTSTYTEQVTLKSSQAVYYGKYGSR